MESEASVAISENVIHCQGRWTVSNLAELERQGGTLRWPEVPQVVYDASQITAMDTGGALLLQQSIETAKRRGGKTTLRGLRPEFSELLQLIGAQWARVSQEGTEREA